jgi:hypothetical protein
MLDDWSTIMPCIISVGSRVYRLDDDDLVLVGNRQHLVLQHFLWQHCMREVVQRMLQASRTGTAIDPKVSEKAYTAQFYKQMLDETPIEIAKGGYVVLETKYFAHDYQRFCSSDSPSPSQFNLSAILISLKRGPLGAAITLPGHNPKKRNYVVNIRGTIDDALFRVP